MEPHGRGHHRNQRAVARHGPEINRGDGAHCACRDSAEVPGAHKSAQIETAFIDPGKPWQNGTDESFNGKFRNECLTLEWFRNRLEAQVAIERRRRHYNEERPHISLGDQTPAEYKAQIKSSCLGKGPETAVLQ